MTDLREATGRCVREGGCACWDRTAEYMHYCHHWRESLAANPPSPTPPADDGSVRLMAVFSQPPHGWPADWPFPLPAHEIATNDGTGWVRSIKPGPNWKDLYGTAEAPTPPAGAAEDGPWPVELHDRLRHAETTEQPFIPVGVDELRRLLSATVPDDGWRDDMENAPRDAPLLLWTQATDGERGAGWAVQKASWLPEAFGGGDWLISCTDNRPVFADNPTHWRPLPPPPGQGKKP